MMSTPESNDAILGMSFEERCEGVRFSLRTHWLDSVLLAASNMDFLPSLEERQASSNEILDSSFAKEVLHGLLSGPSKVAPAMKMGILTNAWVAGVQMLGSLWGEDAVSVVIAELRKI